MHEVRVYDAKGKLKEIITPEMLQDRSDAILRKVAGSYGKSFRIGKPKKKKVE